MNHVIALADFCLKYDHLDHILFIYINKLQILVEDFYTDAASLSFQLLPTEKKVDSQPVRRQANDIYFCFYETLQFKNIVPSKAGSMGLIVTAHSHLDRRRKQRIGDEFKPLDNLDLTSVMTRVIVSLSSNEVDYTEEHRKQTLRLLEREKRSIVGSSMQSREPTIALSLIYKHQFSRIDVYIQRLSNINFYVTEGFILLGFTAQSKLVSTNRSHPIKFEPNTLIHTSIPLETRDLEITECGILIQICPLKKKDILTQCVEFRKDFGVLYAMFGLDTGLPIPAQLLWNDLIDGEINHRNRTHILRVGGINV